MLVRRTCSALLLLKKILFVDETLPARGRRGNGATGHELLRCFGGLLWASRGAAVCTGGGGGGGGGGEGGGEGGGGGGGGDDDLVGGLAAAAVAPLYVAGAVLGLASGLGSGLVTQQQNKSNKDKKRKERRTEISPAQQSRPALCFRDKNEAAWLDEAPHSRGRRAGE